jgi:diamine N-acetyltransferase
MTAAAPFASLRYEVPVDGAEAPLIMEPLPIEEAERLAAAFAAIDPWATYAYPASALATYLGGHEPGAPRFLLTFGGAIAGAMGLRLAWLRGPYIQFLALLPDFQRRGFGSAVLAWVEQETRNANERNLWVAASAINTDAIRLYERHGFRDVAWLDSLVCDGRSEILMRKRL